MSVSNHIKTLFARQIATETRAELKDLRSTAFTAFELTDFPTIRNEEWRYTSLKGISEHDYSPAPAPTKDYSSTLKALISAGVKASRLVFVNGQYIASLSVILPEEKGVILSTLLQQSTHPAFKKHFNQYALPENASLNLLNTSLFADGAFLEIPDHTELKYPLSVIHLTDATDAEVMVQPRNLFVVGKSSKAVIIESHYAIGNQKAFTNVVNEVYADENASLEYYKIQREEGDVSHNNFTRIFQEKGTQINHITLTLDGKWVRNNLHFWMNGPQCNSALYGLYITSDNQHVDNHTRVDHAFPNCFSDEKYKGVLKDHSTAVFNGKIIVHPDAQKTNAYQRNQNILLSNDATVNTKPQLEIFADDVKCTHGATVGQLDEEPMFYLQSRGIPKDVARKMLLNAFAEDIAEKIKIPELVELMERQIDARI